MGDVADAAGSPAGDEDLTINDVGEQDDTAEGGFEVEGGGAGEDTYRGADEPPDLFSDGEGDGRDQNNIDGGGRESDEDDVDGIGADDEDKDGGDEYNDREGGYGDERDRLNDRASGSAHFYESSEEAKQSVSIMPKPRPHASKGGLCCAKIPSLIKFESTPFFEAKERKKERYVAEQLARGRDPAALTSFALDSDGTIRWRFKKDAATGKAILDGNGNPMHEGNAQLIQWSDGSWTMAIGDRQLDCKCDPEKALLLEESDPSLLVSHGLVKQRMTFRPFGLPTSNVGRGGPGVTIASTMPRGITTVNARQKTRLTTTVSVAKSELSTRKQMEQTRDRNARTIRQRLAAFGSDSMGLNADFLEQGAD